MAYIIPTEQPGPLGQGFDFANLSTATSVATMHAQVLKALSDAQIRMQASQDTSAAGDSSSAQLSQRLNACAEQVRQYEMLINSTLLQGGTLTVRNLELALTQVYKLAVFIRGDYDQRVDDEAFRSTVFERCVEAFSSCQSAAADALATLKDLHDKSSALESEDMARLDRDVQERAQTLNYEIQSIQQQKQQSEDQLEDLRRQISAAYENLQQAQSQEEDAGMQMIGALSIFHGMMGARSDEFRQRRADAMDRVRMLEEQLRNQQDNLGRAYSGMADLENQRAGLEQIARQLPVVAARVQQLNGRTPALVDVFVNLKDKSTTLVRLLEELRQRATASTDQSSKKSDFSDVILQICRTALVDRQVCDEVKMICDELRSGYEGSQIPADVSAMLDEVKELTTQAMGKTVTD